MHDTKRVLLNSLFFCFCSFVCIDKKKVSPINSPPTSLIFPVFVLLVCLVCFLPCVHCLFLFLLLTICLDHKMRNSKHNFHQTPVLPLSATTGCEETKKKQKNKNKRKSNSHNKQTNKQKKEKKKEEKNHKQCET